MSWLSRVGTALNPFRGDSGSNEPPSDGPAAQPSTLSSWKERVLGSLKRMLSRGLVPEPPELLRATDKEVVIGWEMAVPYDKALLALGKRTSRMDVDEKEESGAHVRSARGSFSSHFRFDVTYRPKGGLSIMWRRAPDAGIHVCAYDPRGGVLSKTRLDAAAGADQGPIYIFVKGKATLLGLAPDTEYLVRVRALGPDGSTRGPASEVATVRTPKSLDHRRMEQMGRVADFFRGRLSRYPETQYKDTSLAKAERVGVGLMHSLDFVGFGGAYLKAAKTVWKLRYGLGALFLAPDVEEAVANVSRLLRTVRNDLDISMQDAVFGCYYLMAIRRGRRRRDPSFDTQEHRQGTRGVLAANASDELLDQLAQRASLAWAAYAPSPDQLQWIVARLPSPGDTFSVVVSSPSAVRVSKAIVKPAFCVLAHRRTRRCVLAIRGTHSLEDVVVDANHQPAHFPSARGDNGDGAGRDAKDDHKANDDCGSSNGGKDGPAGEDGGGSSGGSSGDNDNGLYCHGGMLRAAQWMAHDEGGGLEHILQRFSDEKYAIEIVGHSLGAGVATLLALLLSQKHESMAIDVYGYAPPACVSPALSNLCNARGDDRTGGVRVRSVVLADDVVPRASHTNIVRLLREVSESKEHWTGTLQRELDDVKRRALGLWAPKRRSTAMDVDSIAQSLDSTSISPDAKDAKQAIASSGAGRKRKQPPRAGKSPDTTAPTTPNESMQVRESPKKPKGVAASAASRSGGGQEAGDAKAKHTKAEPHSQSLVPPGEIVHIYTANGQRHASLVDHTWPGFQRIEVSRHMLRDHLKTPILTALRDARAVRVVAKRTKNRPAPWQRAPPMGPILCSVCGYSVAWASNSDNALEQSRALRHCYACGRIVCVGCASNKLSLPSLGIITPVRVCEHCFLAAPSAAMLGLGTM